MNNMNTKKGLIETDVLKASKISVQAEETALRYMELQNRLEFMEKFGYDPCTDGQTFDAEFIHNKLLS